MKKIDLINTIIDKLILLATVIYDTPPRSVGINSEIYWKYTAKNESRNRNIYIYGGTSKYQSMVISFPLRRIIIKDYRVMYSSEGKDVSKETLSKEIFLNRLTNDELNNLIILLDTELIGKI